MCAVLYFVFLWIGPPPDYLFNSHIMGKGADNFRAWGSMGFTLGETPGGLPGSKIFLALIQMDNPHTQ